MVRFPNRTFLYNISNNAQDENISVRPRALHCASDIQRKEAQSIARGRTSSFLKLTPMVRLGNRTYHGVFTFFPTVPGLLQ